nr:MULTISPECIES: DUF4224 domain-containing protein [Ramlibacter]
MPFAAKAPCRFAPDRSRTSRSCRSLGCVRITVGRGWPVSGITLSTDELVALTGYQQATRQLAVLHTRGFLRAFISRRGDLVLERAHYESVSRGEVHAVVDGKVLAQPVRKQANLEFLKGKA